MGKSENLFSRSGDENESDNIARDNISGKETSDKTSPDEREEIGEKKSLSEKIHDALQDWSNDDQRDQEIDDRIP